MRSGKHKHRLTVNQFLNGISSSCENVEANLSTIFMSVRSTKQYWFLRNSELKCMIREWGTPTLFLKFSCAEYESPDIINYLKKVNNVPDNYPHGKLCTEDPISVSRKFSQKFHSFFQTVLVKGLVLGAISHFFWKKEYQARGAPHYHAVVWIDGAPIIGKSDTSIVLDWVQERITCRIPDETTNPELSKLVKKYQLHKCSAYCKRKRKCNGVYITKCRFGFPRSETEIGEIHSIEDSLISRRKIYSLPRAAHEVRVNDYNPLILSLWRANTDIQYIAESSLALAHYVTGYITKAEKSSMQDLWQEVGSNKSIYSRLWSFGVRSLRSRECGMYEASDILLGDHLYEKSDSVKWIDATQPQYRKRRVKKHSVLIDACIDDPTSMEIFEENVIDNFYPERSNNLENVCLYDFVKLYRYTGKDNNNKRKYCKLNKPIIPNHRIYDPNKEEQRDNYYYSLLLLFVPFSSEDDLVDEGETPEQSFHRHLSTNSQIKAHLERLQQLLKSQNKVKEINESREVQQNNKLDDRLAMLYVSRFCVGFVNGRNGGLARGYLEVDT